MLDPRGKLVIEEARENPGEGSATEGSIVARATCGWGRREQEEPLRRFRTRTSAEVLPSCGEPSPAGRSGAWWPLSSMRVYDDPGPPGRRPCLVDVTEGGKDLKAPPLSGRATVPEEGTQETLGAYRSLGARSLGRVLYK
jgi:hypothetical protein